MDNKKEQLIALKAEWAQFYDNLAGAVNTEAGNLLIMQIQNKINGKTKKFGVCIPATIRISLL